MESPGSIGVVIGCGGILEVQEDCGSDQCDAARHQETVAGEMGGCLYEWDLEGGGQTR